MKEIKTKKLCYLSIVQIIFAILFYAEPCSSFEVALRITDREIVESLAEVKQGQQAMNRRIDDLITNMNKRFEEMNTNFSSRFAAIDKRFEDMNANFNSRFAAIDKRFEDMNANFNSRFAAIDKRFEDMNANFNSRFEAADRRFEDMNKRFEEMNANFNNRFEEMHNTLLTLYASTMALFGGLMGYMIWDRKKSHLPLERKLNAVVEDISITKTNTSSRITNIDMELQQHLDIGNPSGPVIPRLLQALRELARTDEKLADVLRSFSLL
ncbi:conserved hypothetical protein [Desulfamplus magnetovallimortis]|uniref:Uncharacterized protein n=1 Tax=Desulfamplus magnetovallimortis TaxID=1246637 RepID=A0A1W1HAR7_9BACT|nr:hypothetical protein [Desulfamplus magnetovallimortis]SLM29512.1 conserved hypothetical protein [Desulfamplus magnetovallimortis]